MPGAGIEPATQGFSVLCSTDWAIQAWKRVAQGKRGLLFCKLCTKRLLNKLKIMENLTDYSAYILTSYIVAASALGALGFFVTTKYFLVKSKIKNEKSV